MSGARTASAILLALVLTGSAAAQPIAYPTFPTAQDYSTVSAWLALHAGVPQGGLLEVRDGFAFVLLPGPDDPGLRTLRLEVVDGATWRKFSGRSAKVELALACDPPVAEPQAFEVYGGSNLLGDVWRGLPLANLPVRPETWRLIAGVLCDPAVRARTLTRGRVAALVGNPVPSPRPAVATGPYFVQLGAFHDPGGARRALREAAKTAPAAMVGRLTRIEPFTANGQRLYRALVTGFTTQLGGRSFCQLIGRTTRTMCLVRRVR